MMENITKTELIEDIQNGLIDVYLGTFEVGTETRAFYRSYRGAADEPIGYRIVYIVIT